MKKIRATFTVYSWVFKFVAATLLIALAIVLLVMREEFRRYVEAFIGLMIGGYAVMRLVPFIRTQKSDLIKTINIIEITVTALVAAFIMVYTLTYDHLDASFGYIVGSILIIRGTVHFYAVNTAMEKGDHVTFFFHIAALIVGSLTIALGWTSEHLVWLMLFLSFASGTYLSVGAYGGYNLYRKHKQMEKPIETADDVPSDIDIPKKEDPAEEKRIVN